MSPVRGRTILKKTHALPSSRKVMDTGSAFSMYFLFSVENQAANKAEMIPNNKPVIIEAEIFCVTKYMPGITNKLNAISNHKIRLLKYRGSINAVKIGDSAIHRTPTEAFDAFIDA